MKKLLFIYVLMAALCACEAPAEAPETEKEVAVGEKPENDAEETAAVTEDKTETVTDTGPTATPAPDAAIQPGKDEVDKSEPEPSIAPAGIPDNGPETGGGSGTMINVEGYGARDYAKGEELFCMANSEKEAQDIAAVYGITLVRYSYGVATFTTNEDPAAVVKRGNDNGWASLEINYLSSIQ